MGSLYKGVCYPDLLTAQKEVCSASTITWGTDQTVFSSECDERSDENRMVFTMRKNGEPFSYYKQEYPAMPDCDHAGSSALAYEWFLVALGFLVIVWGGKQVLRLFENHQDKD